MDDDAVSDLGLPTKKRTAGSRPVESRSRLWMPLAIVVIVAIAFALHGPSWFQPSLLSGKLKSLGVDVESLPEGGVKVAARQASITGPNLQQIARVPDVMHLDLFGCDAISPAGFGHLASMESLRKLNLSGTQIIDLSPLASCSHLEALVLDRTSIKTSSLQVLGNKASLRLLSANDTLLDDDSLRSLGPAPNLESLYIARTRVTGDALSVLSGFPKLQTLNLSGTELMDADLASDKWPQVASLKQLFLNDLPITDQGLAEFRMTVEKRLPALTSLGLANTKITSASLKVLVALSQLETIRLSGTPIPREDIEKLRLEMPEAYIEGN